MEPKVHPTVTLAEGVIITPGAWHDHGHWLTGGMPNHRVHVVRFYDADLGRTGIVANISPLDQPEQIPLQFRES